METVQRRELGIRNESGERGYRCFEIEQQQEALVAQHGLELGKRHLLCAAMAFAHPSNGFESALIDRPAWPAGVDERANGAFDDTPGRHAGLQLGDPNPDELVVQRRSSRFAQRPCAGGINADGGLQPRIPEDCQEELLGDRLVDLAPSIETGDYSIR